MTATVVPSIVAGVCLLLALFAWRRARRLARRLDALTQTYWQLRYEAEELRLQLQRQADGPAVTGSGKPPSPAGSAFVPLASLKR